MDERKRREERKAPPLLPSSLRVRTVRFGNDSSFALANKTDACDGGRDDGKESRESLVTSLVFSHGAAIGLGGIGASRPWCLHRIILWDHLIFVPSETVSDHNGTPGGRKNLE